MGYRHITQDVTCSYEELSLNARSQQPAFLAKPFPSMGKYPEVTAHSNLMKAALFSGQNIFA